MAILLFISGPTNRPSRLHGQLSQRPTASSTRGVFFGEVSS
jgi:hypothetical protein